MRHSIYKTFGDWNPSAYLMINDEEVATNLPISEERWDQTEKRHFVKRPWKESTNNLAYYKQAFIFLHNLLVKQASTLEIQQKI